ncbi:hypothetical protein MBLNU230_g5094t2 [Neophaeotheca triangularis]
MATRAQDQQLVSDAATENPINIPGSDDEGEKDWSKEHSIIPAFGWHPWFSHQMYDEAAHDNATNLTDDQKAAHYQSVLTPRSENRDFLLSLPDPRPFGYFLAQTRDHLQKHPLALIGEVGLDKSFRIPEAWLPEHESNRDDSLTPGGREGRRLSPYRVNMEHQRKVLLAQLRLAGELQRAVSCHGVQAHGVVHATLSETWKDHLKHVPSKAERKAARSQRAGEKDGGERSPSPRKLREAAAENAKPLEPKPFPPRVCLHSYSGSAEQVSQYLYPAIPTEIFFSFSTTINSWADDGDGKVEAALRAVPDNRVLVESDLHTAGERMDQYLEQIVRKICGVKGWELERGTKQLARNWKAFVFGDEAYRRLFGTDLDQEV